MTLLSHIAADSLEIITRDFDAAVIGRLWLTGDRLLASKLAAGGVSSLCWDLPYGVVHPWPGHFFHNFRSLRTVTWGDDMATSFCPALDLRDLPPTLLTLHISTEEVFCQAVSLKWDLDTLFPQLTDLDFTGARLKAINVKNLPKTLTSLVLGGSGELGNVDHFFRDLPRGLDHLEVWIDIEDQQAEGNDLPPTLRFLSISSITSTFDWLKKVPRTVTDLTISVKGPVKWTSLPNGLQKLYLQYPTNISVDALPVLPKGLTSLSSWIQGGLTDQCMALLPPSLTSLTSFLGNISPIGLQQAPAGLRDLRAKVIASDAEILASFHPDATTMHLTDFDLNFQIELMPLPLPISLTSLSTHYIDNAICLLLPPNLAILSIRGGSFSEEGAKIFPSLQQLHHVTLALRTISGCVIPYLKHIRTLAFTENNETSPEDVQLDPNFIRQLLPSSAIGAGTTAIGETPLSNMDSTSFISGSHASSVAPNNEPISRLRFSFEKFSGGPLYIPREFFQCVTHFSNLLDLHITSYKHNIKSSWFKHFPLKLHTLLLSTLQSFPKPRHLSYLPPSLTSLELSVRSGPKHDHWQSAGICPWTDQDLACLPRKLTTFQMNCDMPHLTAALNEFTPRFLSGFLLNGKAPKHFQDPLTRAFGPESGSDDDGEGSDNDSDDADPDLPFPFPTSLLSSTIRGQLTK